MDTVWILMVWLSVTTLESITYSLIVYLMADPECKLDDTAWWANYTQFLDRITNFQLWLIPLIWFFWPSKANKRNNRSRKRAVNQLKKSINKRENHSSSLINSNDDSTQRDDEVDAYSDDGYSSLDGTESYLDNDNRSEISNNDFNGASAPALPITNNGMGFAQNANIFIIGNQLDDGEHRMARHSSSGIDSKNNSFYLGDRPVADQRNCFDNDTASNISDSDT